MMPLLNFVRAPACQRFWSAGNGTDHIIHIIRKNKAEQSIIR
jgi:hypothetical protein